LLGATNEPLPKLKDATQLAAALDVMAESLRGDRGTLIANDDLQTLQEHVDVFGMHTARLDIRQESGRLISDVDAILYAHHINPPLAKMSRPNQAEHRTYIVQRPRREMRGGGAYSDETNETIALFQLLKRTYDAYGSEPL